MKARIVIGANYGDEGKGTIVAKYTKESNNVLNVLTNGGAQRGHTIKTKDGYITYQHFGSGTYYGADSYYSCYFILNPVQFAQEHQSLIVKPKKVYRDRRCRWTTIYDMMANCITEKQQHRHASCGMGVWNTIKRTNSQPSKSFDSFISLGDGDRFMYLMGIKNYYEDFIDIPCEWKDLWNNPYMAYHFIDDCEYMWKHTKVADLSNLNYDVIIFENGQGLLLSDNGADSPDRTPSQTGAYYAAWLLKHLNDVDDVTVHYVSRTYLTRHGDGHLLNEMSQKSLSSSIEEDNANHYNDNQGEFRYGSLDVNSLQQRIQYDFMLHENFFSKRPNLEIELTHCDEVDNIEEIKKRFPVVNTHSSPEA